MFIGAWGPGQTNIIWALGILFVPSIARVVRAEIVTEMKKAYVANAKLMGASRSRILVAHVMPNIRGTLLVTLVIGYTNAVLAEASLSYLGLGVQPPHASLGRMLSEAQSSIRVAPWCAVFPEIGRAACRERVSSPV